MPIMTKAGTPVKGSPTQFTLDKAALAAVASVAADVYFSNSSNWREVSLVYRSSTGNQSETVKFDTTLASPTANFSVSLKARNIFEIHKIVIKDFDGGSFEVMRSELTTAEFDVDMSPLVYTIYTTSQVVTSVPQNITLSLEANFTFMSNDEYEIYHNDILMSRASYGGPLGAYSNPIKNSILSETGSGFYPLSVNMDVFTTGTIMLKFYKYQ